MALSHQLGQYVSGLAASRVIVYFRAEPFSNVSSSRDPRHSSHRTDDSHVLHVACPSHRTDSHVAYKKNHTKLGFCRPTPYLRNLAIIFMRHRNHTFRIATVKDEACLISYRSLTLSHLSATRFHLTSNIIMFAYSLQRGDPVAAASRQGCRRFRIAIGRHRCRPAGTRTRDGIKISLCVYHGQQISVVYPSPKLM
jgi:hypothetical protein